MNILISIREEIINDSISLSSILRKARVLASHLKHKDFENWVKSELNGYEQDDHTLPEYRRLFLESVGDFSGPFNSGGKNMPIPTMNLPKKVREFVTETQITNGVKSLESIVGKNGTESIHISWPADFVAICQDKIYQRMKLYSARMIIGKSTIEQLLDTIRNRLLEFIIELIEHNPDIGKDEELNTISGTGIDLAFEAHISGSYNSKN